MRANAFEQLFFFICSLLRSFYLHGVSNLREPKTPKIFLFLVVLSLAYNTKGPLYQMYPCSSLHNHQRVTVSKGSFTSVRSDEKVVVNSSSIMQIRLTAQGVGSIGTTVGFERVSDASSGLQEPHHLEEIIYSTPKYPLC